MIWIRDEAKGDIEKENSCSSALTKKYIYFIQENSTRLHFQSFRDDECFLFLIYNPYFIIKAIATFPTRHSKQKVKGFGFFFPL